MQINKFETKKGAIAAIAAFALWEEGLLNGNQMSLITFGSPRALIISTSDRAHEKFHTERYLYGKVDSVPSVPLVVMGFKHYGELRCYRCHSLCYNNARDYPNIAQALDAKEEFHVSTQSRYAAI